MLKKLGMFGSILILAVVMAVSAMAAGSGKQTGPKAVSYAGKVTAVGANMISILSKKTGPHSFSVMPDTKIYVDKVPGMPLGNIMLGMNARIRSKDGATASTIHATTPTPRKSRKKGVIVP